MDEMTQDITEVLKDLSADMDDLVEIALELAEQKEPEVLRGSVVEGRIYNLRQAAQLVGRSESGLRKSQREGRVRDPSQDPQVGGHKYTLEDINEMREIFGTRPTRRPGERALRFCYGNLKGGASKTTMTVHAAHFLAELGYRVLVIDCDPQGTATSILGGIPDYDYSGEDTLYPFLTGKSSSLRGVVKQSGWPGVDFIPANLDLYGAEYELAAGGQLVEGAERLALGIETVEGDYDVILLDSPPALGVIGMTILANVDGLIIVTPPGLYDIMSLRSYVDVLQQVTETIIETEIPVRLRALRILTTRYMPGKGAQTDIYQSLLAQFPGIAMQTPLLDSAAFDTAASRLMTVIEMGPEEINRKTYDRAMSSIAAVVGELEQLMHEMWGRAQPAQAELEAMA